jgi:hypothetical protein
VSRRVALPPPDPRLITTPFGDQAPEAWSSVIRQGAALLIAAGIFIALCAR